MRKVLFGYLGLLALVFIVGVASAQTAAPGDNASTVDAAKAASKGLIAVGAGLAVGLAGLGAGLGEQGIGAAAVGAMAEDPKFFGKGLLMTVIPETIVIFGLVVSLLLIFVYA
jgi:V/A-type H+-transporting ATPase subunit K